MLASKAIPLPPLGGGVVGWSVLEHAPPASSTRVNQGDIHSFVEWDIKPLQGWGGGAMPFGQQGLMTLEPGSVCPIPP